MINSRQRKKLRERAWRVLAVFCLLLPELAGCGGVQPNPAPASVFSGWKYSDLWHLQTPDPDSPASLIAVYQRQTRFDLEIRLDFLDLTAPLDFDLYLALDVGPGGGTELPQLGIQSRLAYDLLLKIPASGAAVVLDEGLIPLANLIPRVSDQPELDAMVIQLNRAQLPGNPAQLGVQVFQTAAGKNKILSQTPPLAPGQARPAYAPLLLVFWDSLPGATPAQTLRRWDGAHTGPLGRRHGLNVLLQAAASQGVPLVLADLKQTGSLVGLNLVGGLKTISALADRGLVILPDVAHGDPRSAEQSLRLNRTTARANGLSTSAIGFGAFNSPLPANYTTFFAALPARNRIVTWQGKRLVPLPQASPDPVLFSDEVRRELLTAALSADPGDLVISGGSLPASTWGDAAAAQAAFAYIAAHPWIRVLDEAGLAALPAQASADWPLPAACQDLLCSPPAPQNIVVHTGSGQPAPGGLTYAQLQDSLRRRLAALGVENSPAWQAYLALTGPSADPRQMGLQANALGQVGYLIEFERWQADGELQIKEHEAAAPMTIRISCGQDLDFDGSPECQMESPTWLVILKPEGGRLVFAAARGSQGATQWIGASSQFAVGLGDPSEWRPELGPAGDPGQIAGAFAPPQGPYEMSTLETRPAQVIFRSPGAGLSKTFSLSPDGLKVEIRSERAESFQIPLVLAPAQWQTAPSPTLNEQTWRWQPPTGPGLKVTFSGEMTLAASAWLDARPGLIVSENPDRAYPRGHYLPYPLALISGQGRQWQVLFTAE